MKSLIAVIFFTSLCFGQSQSTRSGPRLPAEPCAINEQFNLVNPDTSKTSYLCKFGHWSPVSGASQIPPVYAWPFANWADDGKTISAPAGRNVAIGTTVVDPANGFLGVYDDFNRADTALGVLGTPNLGPVWELRGASMATNPGKTQITSGKWVSAAGDIVYALQTLKARPSTIGAQFSFTSNGGATLNAALAIGVSTAYASFQNMIHTVVTPTSWTVSVWKAGVQDHTVGTGTFSPALKIDGTSYTVDLTFAGNTLIVRPPQGAVASFVDTDLPNYSGQYVFFEHFYSSATDVISLLRIEKTWATHGLPKIPGLTVGDITSFSTVNPAASITAGFRTSPALTSTDRSVGPLRVFAAKIVAGSAGSGSTGTVQFGTVWPSAPACSATDENTPVQPIYVSVSTSIVTITASSAWGASDKIDVLCIGM